MTAAAAPSGDWRSFHLYYHGDLDRALLDFVRPVTASLRSQEVLDSFFFIRYAVGGPHIRLRLRAVPGGEELAEREVREAAAAFLALWPSLEPRDEEAIRARSHAILAQDPNEHDEKVYPDNTLLAMPFHPETERYGGPELLPHSLDFFALSSVSALHFLASQRGQSRGRVLTSAFRHLARQLWSFATSAEEALAILSAFVQSRGLDSIVEQGERVFERQQEALRGLLRDELANLIAGESMAGGDIEGSRRLSSELASADNSTRCRIGASQLHMTANRIGVTNPEEAYLGRLLERTSHDVAIEDPSLWALLLGELARQRYENAGPLRTLLAQALL